jgi:hypothetical protein
LSLQDLLKKSTLGSAWTFLLFLALAQCLLPNLRWTHKQKWWSWLGRAQLCHIGQVVFEFLESLLLSLGPLKVLGTSENLKEWQTSFRSPGNEFVERINSPCQFLHILHRNGSYISISALIM